MFGPSKLAKVATACTLLTLNDLNGKAFSVANAVELEVEGQDGFVKLPIKKVAYEFTQVETQSENMGTIGGG